MSDAIVDATKRILAYTVAFDPPDSGGCRQMARMLGASVARTYLEGDFFIIRNAPEPLFLIQRVGIDEIYVETEALEHQALADLGNRWKFVARQVLDPSAYEVVFFLDVDCLVLRNLDHLFVGDDWDILYQPEPGRKIQDGVFNGYLSDAEMASLHCDGRNAGTWAVRPSGPWRERRAERKGAWPEAPPIRDGERVAFVFSEADELPEAWQGYLESAGERASVYCRTGSAPGTVAGLRAQRDLLQRALQDPANAFFVILAEGFVPVRPFGDFLHLLELDGRSRFGWHLAEDLMESGTSASAAAEVKPLRMPRDLWVVHGRGLLLNREAAALVVEDDFTPWMESVSTLDRCYYGTVLNMKGYPLGDLVANQVLCLEAQQGEARASNSKRLVGINARQQAAALWASGCFFARTLA